MNDPRVERLKRKIRFSILLLVVLGISLIVTGAGVNLTESKWENIWLIFFGIFASFMSIAYIIFRMNLDTYIATVKAVKRSEEMKEGIPDGDY